MDAGKPFITTAGEVTANSNKSYFFSNFAMIVEKGQQQGMYNNCILLESDCPYLEKTLANFMPNAQKLVFIKQTSLCDTGPCELQYGIIASAAKLLGELRSKCAGIGSVGSR